MTSACTVHILWSFAQNRYYTGITNDLVRRLDQHLKGETKATAKAKDWLIAWSTVKPDHGLARQLEKKIKARGAKRFLDDQGALDHRDGRC
jgi:putative endonuclease